MVTGEHAVLHGARALVGAVDSRVTVALEPRAGRRAVIRSALGTRDTPLDRPDASPPFHFIGTALARLGRDCPSGFSLDIKADMPPDVGLGSSAAVTVAVLGALHAWIGGALPPPAILHREALALVRFIQGAASGADLAASIRGGVLCYRQDGVIERRHTVFPPVELVYAGYKTPTGEVIRQVESLRQASPDGFRDIYARMDACTAEADTAFAASDWPRLASALRQGQCLMEELGVCDPTLAAMVRCLHGVHGVSAAKISGSGLGDGVLALGELPPETILPWRRIPVHFSNQGVTLDIP